MNIKKLLLFLTITSLYLPKAQSMITLFNAIGHMAERNTEKEIDKLYEKMNKENAIPIMCSVLVDQNLRLGYLNPFKKLVDQALKLGVNINKKFHGFTILHIATLSGRYEAVRYLISKNADVNAQPDKEVKEAQELRFLFPTPLMMALACNHYNTNDFIEAGADVDIKNDLGNTPLHMSVLFKGGCVEQLKSNLYVRNNDGLTPLELADIELKKLEERLTNGDKPNEVVFGYNSLALMISQMNKVLEKKITSKL